MILVLSPHGDDAELAMGGTMAILARQQRVRHVVMALTDYVSSDGVTISEQLRLDEAARACCELKVELHAAPFPDNGLTGVLPGLVAYIDDLLRVFRPTDVYTCLPWFNADHDALYRASLAAMRKVGQNICFWGYEMPGQGLGYTMPEHGWMYSRLDRSAIDCKMRAISAYDTQKLAGKSGPVSLNGTMRLAELRGCECNAEWAERQLLLRGERAL
jgi:LmbE family N-acetylglucosaminyl deacetylase